MIYTNVGPFGPLQTDFGDRLDRGQPQTGFSKSQFLLYLNTP